MKENSFFITGTDTGVGKTWAALCLMRLLQARGLRMLGMKPVATGAIQREGRWVNEDALALRGAASFAVPYDQVNPYVYAPPTSPHIAAALAGEAIDLARIVKLFKVLEASADGVLVEGVGGWLAPLGARERVADLALALDLPVILVVGMRLGCLNHALLSHAAIRASGATWAGWIANHPVHDFPYAAETLALLTAELEGPPLAGLPHGIVPDRLQAAVFPTAGLDGTLRLLGS